jgi:hypothetical protein
MIVLRGLRARSLEHLKILSMNVLRREFGQRKISTVKKSPAKTMLRAEEIVGAPAVLQLIIYISVKNTGRKIYGGTSHLK